MAKKSPAPNTSPAAPAPTIVADYDLTALTENPDNPRTITEAGRRDLTKSIAEFGMVETIVANQRPDGTVMVLGGHQRLRCLLDAGTVRGPVTLVRVTPSQERRLNLMLNGHHGQWDADKIRAQLAEIVAEGEAVTGMGLEGIAPFEAFLVSQADMDESIREATEAAQGAGAAEVDVDGITMRHRCPQCGFEYNEDTDAGGGRGQTRTDKFKRPAVDAEGNHGAGDEPLDDDEDQEA